MPEESDNGRVSIEVGDGVSRRSVLKQVAAASTLFGIAGCLRDNRGETPASGESPTDTPTETTPDTPVPTESPPTDTPLGTPVGGPPADGFEFSRHPAVAPPGWDAGKTAAGDGLTERRAVFVIQNIDNSFFIPLVAGFHDALRRYGWTGAVRGPGQAGTHGDRIEIIEDEIDGMDEGDVLVTTILDDTTYNDAIQTALDNDIVVVNGHTTPAARDWNYDVMREEIGFTYTSPVTGEEREMIVPHVGIRDEHGGAAMAAETYERLRAGKPDQDEYTVVLMNDLPDNPQVTRRVDANAAVEGTAQRYFEARGDVEVFEDQVFATPQPPQVAESQNFVVDTIQGKGVDAVVTSAFWAGAGAGEARSDGELAEDILICGFDLAGYAASGLIGNEVDFVVCQDLYGQGYRSAEVAWTWLERGIPMKDLEWGVSVWDERNAEFASQRRSWDELLEWQRNNYGGIQ